MTYLRLSNNNRFIKTPFSKIIMTTHFIMYNKMRMKFLTIIILSLVSCSTIKENPEFIAAIRDGRCEEATKQIPNSGEYKIISTSKSLATNAYSYLLTGTSYAAEFTLTVSVGVLAGVVLCSPLLALELGLKGDGQASGQCVAGIFDNVYSSRKFNYSKKVYEKTQKFTCPNLDSISERTRLSAQCFIDRNKGQDKENAESLIVSLYKSELFQKCVSEKEKNQILKFKELFPPR
jgi:hypothetical protein